MLETADDKNSNIKPAKAIKILSSLAQETRLAIFRILIQESDAGLSAGTIAEILQVPATTLSFHLSHLTNAGLIRPRKEGRVVMYRVKNKIIKELYNYLTENSYKKRNKNIALKS